MGGRGLCPQARGAGVDLGGRGEGQRCMGPRVSGLEGGPSGAECRGAACGPDGSYRLSEGGRGREWRGAEERARDGGGGARERPLASLWCGEQTRPRLKGVAGFTPMKKTHTLTHTHTLGRGVGTHTYTQTHISFVLIRLIRGPKYGPISS